MSKLTLQIVTPESEILNEQVDEVVLPSQNGSMGVLPGHAPLMALMDVGAVEYRQDGERNVFSVAGGFAEVLRDSVKVLANTCESATEIDVERAQRSKAKGEAKLKSLEGSDAAFKLAEYRIRKAINRIDIAQRYRGDNW